MKTALQKKEKSSLSEKNNETREGGTHLAPPQFSLAGDSPLQAKMANPVQRKSGGGGSYLNPPGFSVSAGPVQRKADPSGTEPIQRETKSLPENLGPTQTGPIAEKGDGDSHAFSANDINQGSIGDCYFLASLGAVANTNPGLLEKAITPNSDGTYNVKLYMEQESGWWIFKKKNLVPVTVKIYPNFPTAANGVDTANPNAASNPAHAHGGDQNAEGKTELWVRLIEKAYALLIGSYAQIGNGGLTADALETLTGKRFTEKVITDQTAVKARIIEMVAAGIPVCASCISLNGLSTELQTFAAENSILCPHAYTVMRASTSNITLRNPHGTGARVAEPVLTWAQFFAMFTQFSDQD